MKNRKKISFLIYSLAAGGAERVLSLLLNELESKYDITLFLMNDTIFYAIPDTINIIYLEKSSPYETGIKKLLKLPLLAFKYKKLNKADISFSFMNRPNYINVLSKLFGMKSKIIVSERAMPTLQHKYGLQGFINRFLIKSLYTKADVITTNSIGNNIDLQVNFNIKDIITINNPFNLEVIDKNSKEDIRIPKNNKFTFVTIGRLDIGKNHRLIIKAMRDIDAKLLIIGDGPLKTELENLVKEYKLEENVYLLGKQSNPFKYLSKSDCFVFTSNHEGFPNVLVEALACALPVISTDCLSGPREILTSKNNISIQLKNNIELAEYGILIPINNEDKLKESMKLMINNKELREKYTTKAKNRANDFSIKKIIKQYEDVICAE